jgi:4-aminobutyrate aminotransferase-like enzyme
VQGCFERGLLLNCTQERVLRIFPPFIVQKKEVDEALSILKEVLANR